MGKDDKTQQKKQKKEQKTKRKIKKMNGELGLVLRGSVLQHLGHAVAIVCRGGRLVVLLDGEDVLLLGDLEVLLQLLHSPVESVELSLGGEDLRLLGLLGEDLLLELLRELGQVDLQRLALLVELGELLLRLVAADQSLLHFLLHLVTLVTEVVLLHLHGLDLLLDSLHGEMCAAAGSFSTAGAPC